MANTELAQHISGRRSHAIDSIIDNKIVSLELCDFIFGELLGSGISRYVFDYKPDKKWVIKVDVSDYNANVIEHKIWEHVKFTKNEKWFAPCGTISRCGRIMLQRKVEYATYDKYPKKMPTFLTDFKYQNFGLLEGKLVCVDYAGAIITSFGERKLKIVEWWNG